MFLRPGRLLYVGAANATELHAHHAFQLMVSFAEPLELGGAGPRRFVSRAALVPTDAAHAIRRPASLVAILYLVSRPRESRRSPAPLSGRGRSESGCLGAGGKALKPLCREQPPEIWSEAAHFAARAVTAVLGPSAAVVSKHPAVRRALEHAARHLERRIGIAELAAAGGVSVSYLSRTSSRLGADDDGASDGDLAEKLPRGARHCYAAAANAKAATASSKRGCSKTSL